MKPLTRALLPLAVALTLPCMPARAADVGPYAIIAVGRTVYDFDCYFFADCDNARASSGKLVGGYQFGIFAIEGVVTDWGRGATPFGNSLHLRSVGLNAAWHLKFSNNLQGLLRAGAAQVRQTRTDDGSTSHLEGTFGLGLSMTLTPTVAAELAWDATTSTGNNSGSVLAQAFSLGLRLRF